MHLAELYCRLYFPSHLVSGRWAGGAIWKMYPVNWTTLVAPALAWLYVTLAVCFGLAQLYVAMTACMSIKQVLGGVALVSVTNLPPSRLLVVGGSFTCMFVDQIILINKKIRSQYIREKKKVQKKKTGMGLDEAYIMKWAYYYKMQFLDDFVTPKERTSNFEVSRSTYIRVIKLYHVILPW